MRCGEWLLSSAGCGDDANRFEHHPTISLSTDTHAAAQGSEPLAGAFQWIRPPVDFEGVRSYKNRLQPFS